jgi:hypothetical protein
MDIEKSNAAPPERDTSSSNATRITNLCASLRLTIQEFRAKN